MTVSGAAHAAAAADVRKSGTNDDDAIENFREG